MTELSTFEISVLTVASVWLAALAVAGILLYRRVSKNKAILTLAARNQMAVISRVEKLTGPTQERKRGKKYVKK